MSINVLEAATRLDAFEQEITSYLSLVSRSFCIQNCVLFVRMWWQAQMLYEELQKK